MSNSSSSQAPLRNTAAPPAPQSGSYSVIVCVPGRGSWTVPLLDGRVYTVGRDPASDIVVDCACVSYNHARITGGDPPELVDIGSRNGTVVGARMVERHSPSALPGGTVVTLGSASLFIQQGEPDSEAPARPKCLTLPLQEQAEATVAPRSSTRRAARSGVRRRETFVTREEKLQELLAFAQQIAPSEVAVLILGETGVGKELLAAAIHEHSTRSRQPLVTLNCAAIPENLVESELFGYERGAFSGAVGSKPGLFEAAHGSTLFLDEVGELPITVQPKLLRVLETGEVMRLGSVKPTRVDVRVVAATNRNINAEVVNGTFRADLFYRLNGMKLEIPPLRERPKDIVGLAEYFVSSLDAPSSPRFTDEALSALCSYDWPGNIRELRSVVERAVLLAQGRVIDTPHLVFDRPRLPLEAQRRVETQPVSGATFPPEELPTSAVRAELERRERAQIQSALERTGGNQKDAAKLLGISRRTLIKRLDRYGVARPRKRREDLPEG